MKMVVFLTLFFSLLCYTAVCEELLYLGEQVPASGAVDVEGQHLKKVSGSVLGAETWVRDHILGATNNSTIVVRSTILCRQQSLGLLLPALSNLHHSLTRWGLHHHIKVAAALSSDCHAIRRKLSHKANPAAPAFALPPLVGTLPPAPHPNPNPILSPPHLPPCQPAHSVGPGPGPAPHVHHGTWCVAKPSVPAETLQEALDYACGEGEADCEAIKEDGNCYYPDSLVAHASYAFNSYWQKTKANGGTCGFGGTAIIITSDPSYGHCRFSLT